MSWRAESTYKPSSAFADDEKEFLKVAKKIREVLKLEERQAKGETLEKLQAEKVSSKEALLKEVVALAIKLPGETEVLAKNQDITSLLPPNVQRDIEKKRKQEEEKKQRRTQREEVSRKQPEFMIRHDRPILAVAASRSGERLYTCSKDKYVLCWSRAKPLLSVLTTFAGHSGAVWTIDVSPPIGPVPALLLSGGADGQVHLWEAEPSAKPGAIVAPWKTLDHGGIVRVLRWCPFDDEEAATSGRRFASASEKLGSKPPMIGVWRVTPAGEFENLLQLTTELPTKANDLAWGGGAKIKLFSAHDNGYIGVWLAEKPGTLMKTIKLHAGPVSSLSLTARGSTLITASHDMTAKAVDVTKPTMDTLATWQANRPLNAVAASSDFEVGRGTVVIAGGKDPRDVTRAKDMQEDEFEALVLDAASGDQVAAGKGHFGPIHALLSLPGINAVASASEDGCLRVHRLDGQLLHSDTLQ